MYLKNVYCVFPAFVQGDSRGLECCRPLETVCPLSKQLEAEGKLWFRFRALELR